MYNQNAEVEVQNLEVPHFDFFNLASEDRTNAMQAHLTFVEEALKKQMKMEQFEDFGQTS